MIGRPALLSDLQALLKELEADLRERATEVPELDARLREDHRLAREAGRTADAFEEWREEPITQAAAAWILGCVFVRFMEDNGLVETPRLSGPGDRRTLARDHHTLFFQKHPTLSDREYLEDVFRQVATLPAAKELFDQAHNALWTLGVSGDGARKLLEFWRRVEPATGALIHDFSDPEWNTRFLGDLYQDLSEAARKRYALLQTPEFVEEFILDRTLDPAIGEFGYKDVRLIDTTCGSGHFLLGAFDRLFALHQRHAPGTNPPELVQRALDGVWGVDLNPFAVAIARFRLLVAGLKACDTKRLKDAPAFRIHLAVGDSLLHGPRFAAIAGVQATLDPSEDPLRHVYATEDREALKQILGQRYHAVVGNPPYITVKDKALNAAYRQKYGSCHMKYSLAVPFMERFFELALPGRDGQPAGFTGMITANSFMKREFGTKLIEDFIPCWDLTHVIDTSGAYIPGHGTPTVVLFGRNRSPVSDSVRAVMGIRGEPQTPDDPSQGLVWTAITQQVDQAGSSSEWVSVSDTPRATFHSHPWSLGGGGAAELKELLEERANKRLGDIAESIGITSFTLEDDLFLLPWEAARRLGIGADRLREMVLGDSLRDWQAARCDPAIFPYDDDFRPIPEDPTTPVFRYLWPGRTVIANNKMFGGKTKVEAGLRWYEFGRLTDDKLRTPLSIAFAEVASHNHFVLDRGGKVFNRTAPVIKLPEGATEDDHLALLGLLNSSTGCFWLRQVCFPKGGDHVGTEGARVRKTLWEERFAFNATNLLKFPLPDGRPLLITTSKRLDRLGSSLQALPEGGAKRAVGASAPGREGELASAYAEQMARAIALQEELDWECYGLFGLVEQSFCHASLDGLPRIALGQRAFEIVLARRVAAGEAEPTWFGRHGSTPITEIPAHWPEDYRQLVQRRIEAIETNPHIRLIEQPEYKRRWKTEPWEEQLKRALKGWLLDRLEAAEYWPKTELTSCARLADRAHQDADFKQVATLYTGRADFDVTRLVTDLVIDESVPFLPVLRYKESGLRNRALWERTWDLQRREDRGEKLDDIPVPPKYTSADFQKGSYWRLRGKLDVPKERFVSYPGCERDADPTPLVAWAGWDHLQQAQALAAFYIQMKETEGWPVARLTPLLAGLLELLPWLEQWHDDLDPAFGMGMGQYFRSFLDEEARALELTLEAIRAWKPAGAARRTRRKR